MSRRSLEQHQQRVTQMIDRDPAQASFFRKRYEALSSLRSRKSAADSYYDSQDETDISRHAVYTKSLLRRLITVITTFFSAIYERTTSVFRRNQTSKHQYYSSHLLQEKKGKHLNLFRKRAFIKSRFSQESFGEASTRRRTPSYPCSGTSTCSSRRPFCWIRGS